MTPEETLERVHLLLDDGLAERALQAVLELEASAEDAGRPKLVARTSREAAQILVSLGRPADAVARLERTRAWLDGRASALTIGLLDVALASALRADHRSPEALVVLTAAEHVLARRVPELTHATVRHDQAVLLAELGRTDEGIRGLVAARETFLGSRDRLGVAAADHNLGFVLHDLGNFDDAIEYLQEARNIFLALDRPEEAAACDQNLGVVLFDLHRFEEAGRRFAVAHHRFEAAGALRSAGECDYNLGALLRGMGREEEAAQYRRRALDAGVEAPLDMGLSGQFPVVEGAVDLGGDGSTGSASE